MTKERLPDKTQLRLDEMLDDIKLGKANGKQFENVLNGLEPYFDISEVQKEYQDHLEQRSNGDYSI